MAQERDIMSTFKKLSRINKEGGTMSSEERNWFEEIKKKSKNFEDQANASMKTTKLNLKD
ncbi:hypothetical protein [Spirosoma sordidisoli]|uniref:Uncharacterized protein n=1 Tax=Spirosoma sordidisoli TaxID=2502893 RepID=A0A4Q2UJ46_9BACT|nr:hypothetical protein [Spirosoma sordidisoli]RYC69493.1 hypothetical protein EQG79_12880 [Spirosoma sordidisoli]